MELEIYGFSGKIGSGKDHIAREIFPDLMRESGKEFNPIYLSFADILKSICAARYNLCYNELYTKKSSRARKFLQDVGDEIKGDYGSCFFVKAMEIEIFKHATRNGIKQFIIPDIRFPEELKWFKRSGGKTIRIEAPERSWTNLLDECNGDEVLTRRRASHWSETILDEYEFDGVIHNEVGDDPREELLKMIQPKPKDPNPDEDGCLRD